MLADGGSIASSGVVSNYTIQESSGVNLLINSSGTWTCQRDNVTVTASMWGQVLTADSRVLVQFNINGTTYDAGSDSFDSASGYRAGATSSQVMNTGDTLMFSTGGAGNMNVINVNFTATAPSEHIVAYNSRNAENSMIRLHTGNGHGSVNNKIRRFSTTVADLGNAITYADSATDGASFTINEDGVYMVSYSDTAAASSYRGISLNSSELTTNIVTITTTADRLAVGTTPDASTPTVVAWSGKLNKGDILRPHTDGVAESAASRVAFTISKIGVGDLLGVPVPRTAYIKDVKPSGTAGGTFTAGAWQTRDLNTLEGDTEFISLSANQVTLSSGKYKISASAPCFRGSQNKIKLRNITNSTDDIIGGSSFAPNDTSFNGFSRSEMEGVIEISSNTTFEIQHRCSSTRASDGFGIASSFSVDEIYATLVIEKIA